jgi:hypothetical protein
MLEKAIKPTRCNVVSYAPILGNGLAQIQNLLNKLFRVPGKSAWGRNGVDRQSNVLHQVSLDDNSGIVVNFPHHIWDALQIIR